jgi:hypothetical protein
MKLTAALILFLCFSCGQKRNDKTDNTSADSLQEGRYDTNGKPVNRISGSSGEVDITQEINALLNEKFGDTLTIVSDKDAGWAKDLFDYFIVPQRKDYPEYPYAAKGDFNGDGQQDAAVLVK